MKNNPVHSLSKGQKIALWLTFHWLGFCLLGSLIESWISLMVICITLLAAVVCLLINKLDAKYAWLVFVASLVLPFVTIAVLAETKTESGTLQGEEKNEQLKETVVTEETEKSAKEGTGNTEKEQKRQLSTKEQEIADAAAKQGLMFGMAGASNEDFSNMLDLTDYVEGMEDEMDKMFEEMAGGEYDKEYGSPVNTEEKKLKKIYIEHFIEAMKSTMDGMDTLDKLGGKRK